MRKYIGETKQRFEHPIKVSWNTWFSKKNIIFLSNKKIPKILFPLKNKEHSYVELSVNLKMYQKGKDTAWKLEQQLRCSIKISNLPITLVVIIVLDNVYQKVQTFVQFWAYTSTFEHKSSICKSSYINLTRIFVSVSIKFGFLYYHFK